MNLQDLRSALDVTNGTLTLTTETLDARFGDLLRSCYRGRPLVVTGAEITQTEQAVIVTGTSSFLEQADVPFTARLGVNDEGKVKALLEYALIGEIPGPNPWTLSRSLPQLPPVWDYAAGYPLWPIPGDEMPAPAYPPQRPYVDSLVLSNARLVVCTGTWSDPTTGAPLRPGINLVANIKPQGALGILEHTLRASAEPLVVYGTIRVPLPTEVTRPLAMLEPVWARPDAPGVHLQADLALDLSLGKLVLDRTSLRIYTPPSTDWQQANPSFTPKHGYAARLAIPSADIELELAADLEWNLPRATLYARPQGITLGTLTGLADLVGGGGLSTALPAPLRKAAGALEQVALTYVSISLGTGTGTRAGTVAVDEVSVEIGMPGLEWKVWKDDLVVRDIACRFQVVNPFGSAAQRTVAVTLMGTVEIEGVAIDVVARSDRGFTLYAAMAEGERIPLGSLMKRYAPGVPVPASLTVTSLRMLASPGKSYSMATTVAGTPKPWTIPVGRSELVIGELLLELGYAGGEVTGTFAGSATYGDDLRLDVVYSIPGDIMIRSVIDEISLSGLVDRVAGTRGALPDGFDLTLTNTSVLIRKQGSDYVFQAGTQLDQVGALALEVRKVAGASWGFAAGFALTSPLSELPGLGALAPLEKVFPLSKLMVTASSFDAPSFQFPDMAQLNAPRLAGQGAIALPAQAGLTAGLCVYAQWAIDTKDKSQKMLRKFLGLPTRLGVTLQVGKDPAKQSKLFVDFTTKVSGNPLVCQFGAMMNNGQPALFLDGELSVKIDRQPVTFSVTMLMVTSGMFLSGTMAGTVKLGSVKLSNLAVMTAVSWSGIPSLGIAATIGGTKFSSSIAVMFDSTNPAKSLFAGSVSDLTLEDVATALATAKKLPAEVRTLLARFGVEGTQPFTIPGATRTALDNIELGEVSQAFAQAGVKIPSSPASVLLVVSQPGTRWQLTDLSDRMRHYQLVRQGDQIRVTVDAQVYCAPQATTIGKLRFDQGFFLNGTLDVLGVRSTTTVDISPNKGLAIDSYLDKKVVIYKPGFFSVSDRSGKKGPKLSVSTFSQPRNPDPTLRKPHFYLDGKIVLLGLKSSVLVKVTTGGAQFAIEQSRTVKLSGGKGTSGKASSSFEISGQVGARTLRAGGGVSVKLSGRLNLGRIKAAGQEIDLGTIKLSFAVQAQAEVGFADNKAFARLSGSFQFQGERFRFETKLDVDQASLAKVEKAIVAQIERAFADALRGPEKWVKWANKGLVEGFEDAKKASRALKDVYNRSSKDAAKLMKGAGYAVEEVGEALQDSYQMSEKAMKDALEGAGFAARSVDQFTKNAFASAGKELEKAGKSVEKGAKDAGKAIKKGLGKIF